MLLRCVLTETLAAVCEVTGAEPVPAMSWMFSWVPRHSVMRQPGPTRRSGEIDGGWLHGRGACDSKAGRRSARTSSDACCGSVTSWRAALVLPFDVDEHAGLLDETFPAGGAKFVRSSPPGQVTLAGAGVTLHTCLAAADQLGRDGIHARILDLYSIKSARHRRRPQGNEDDLGAFAAYAQDPVAVFFAEVGDIRASGLEDPQAEQPEHGYQREIARAPSASAISSRSMSLRSSTRPG